jgi:hypothetical protein
MLDHVIPEGLPVGWMLPVILGILLLVVVVKLIRWDRKPEEKSTPMPPPWICPQCGEELEGQFGQCWKCQTPHPDQRLTPDIELRNGDTVHVFESIDSNKDSPTKPTLSSGAASRAAPSER